MKKFTRKQVQGCNLQLFVEHNIEFRLDWIVNFSAFQRVFKGLNKIASLHFKEAVTFHGVPCGEIHEEASSRMQSSAICSSEHNIEFRSDWIVTFSAFQYVFKGLNKIASLHFKEAVTFHGVPYGEIHREASSRMQSSAICSSEHNIKFKLNWIAYLLTVCSKIWIK